MATIKCNFESVLAQFESVESLNSVVKEINAQLTEAYKKRYEAIKPKAKKDETVTVSVSSDGTKKPTSAAKKGETKNEKKGAKKSETKATKKTEKKESKKRERTYEVEQIALTDTKAVKKLGLKFVPYNEKCVLLLGDTKPIAQALRNLKKSGVFGNGHLKAVKGFDGGFGWLVNKEHENYAQVCKSLGLKKAV